MSCKYLSNGKTAINKRKFFILYSCGTVKLNILKKPIKIKSQEMSYCKHDVQIEHMKSIYRI